MPKTAGVTTETIPGHISRPDIVVPDTTPLIQLALICEPRQLHEIGGAVFLVDIVADEAIRDLTKPSAAHLSRWIAA